MIAICFVLYDLRVVGGVERVVENLANKLSDNYIVHVVSLHGDEVNPALHFKESITLSFFNLKEARLRHQMIRGSKQLYNFYKKNKIKVAFLEATFVGFIGAPMGLFSKTKVVFCDHGALYNQLNDNEITSMRKVAAHFCNYVVVLTKKSKEDYEKIFNLRKTKISYIYNGIRDSLINDRRRYNLESKIILTVGRFTKEKGFDLLLDVAKIVMPINPGWQWHIYGEGPLEETIKNEIKESGLSESVILCGFSEEVNKIYENAAMYVLPSYREGIPLVLLEAKAFKLPTISFDIVTGPNEIIEDGKNGYLITPYDTKSMADCINQLIRDENLRKKLSENAYNNINKFREEEIVNQWESLIALLSS